jgi:hypothetical protein
MLTKSFKTLKIQLGIIFLVSIFLGSFHHHDDGLIHHDCPVYILQAHVSDADTPVENTYITDLDLIGEAVLGTFASTYSYRFQNSLHSRAPPSLL